MDKKIRWAQQVMVHWTLCIPTQDGEQFAGQLPREEVGVALKAEPGIKSPSKIHVRMRLPVDEVEGLPCTWNASLRPMEPNEPVSRTDDSEAAVAVWRRRGLSRRTTNGAKGSPGTREYVFRLRRFAIGTIMCPQKTRRLYYDLEAILLPGALLL